MGTRPTLIDLGVYSREHSPDPLHAPDQPQELSTRSWRWWPVALVALLVWPLAGAAAAPPPPLNLLWTESDGVRSSVETAVGDTDLYAVTAAADGPALTAFRLADGSVRWEVPLVTPGAPEWPSSPGAIGVRLIDGMLLVHSYEVPETVAAYDPETARLRWTGQGYPDPFGAGLVVLAAYQNDSPGADLVIRELDTGRMVSSFDHTAGQFAHQAPPDGPARLVGLSRDGVLTSYDPFSGAVLHRVETPHEERLEASIENFVSIVDDLVLVTDYTHGPDLAAYDGATLAPLWTIREAVSASACAPMLCVQTAAPDGRPIGLHGVDPITGTTQWSMNCSDGDAGFCYLMVREMGRGGRVLVENWAMDDDSDWENGFWVIDSTTGRRLAEPGRWRFAAFSDDGVMLGRGGEGEFWLASADLELARIEVLGVVEADWCTPYGSHLVCTTEAEPFQVWQISRPGP